MVLMIGALRVRGSRSGNLAYLHEGQQIINSTSE